MDLAGELEAVQICRWTLRRGRWSRRGGSREGQIQGMSRGLGDHILVDADERWYSFVDWSSEEMISTCDVRSFSSLLDECA
jgi:hypothetical protein